MEQRASRSGPALTPRVTVCVVALCSARHIERCLAALEGQQDAPPFDVVVAHDPALPGTAEIRRGVPGVRFVSEQGRRNPIDLAALALREAAGETILLTEDHCEASPAWVRTLSAALAPGRAAVGGEISTPLDSRAVAWAFYFADFFRYAPRVREEPSPVVSVCNAAYRRADLERIRPQWESGFHETAAHALLCREGGRLWLVPGAGVTMRRNVLLGHALRERYSLGRLFSARRLAFLSPARRALYSLLAPLLPALLLARMARHAARCGARVFFAGFVRSLVPLVAMVLAWSWGEWLGYLTARAPERVFFAPEAEN
jgi:hypothetical protein